MVYNKNALTSVLQGSNVAANLHFIALGPNWYKIVADMTSKVFYSCMQMLSCMRSCSKKNNTSQIIQPLMYGEIMYAK